MLGRVCVSIGDDDWENENTRRERIGEHREMKKKKILQMIKVVVV